MRAWISGNAIRNFLSGRSSSMTDRSLQELANAEDVSVAEMMSDNGALPEEDHKLNNISSQPAPSVTEDTAPKDEGVVGSPFRPVEPLPYEPTARDIPVRGVGAANRQGEFQLVEGPIDHAPRPAGIPAAKDVYALYVVGDSMFPRYKPGTRIYVSPHRLPLIGDDVVIQIHEEDGSVRAMVKTLVRQTSTKYVLEQYNPKGTMEIAKAHNVFVHRVFETNELQGE